MKESLSTDSETEESLKLLIWQRRLVVITLILAITFLLFHILQIFADIVRIISVSIFVCYLIVGVVDKLEKPLRSRLLSVLFVYGSGVLFAGSALVILIPSIVQQISGFVGNTLHELPGLVEWLGAQLAPLENKLHILSFEVKPSELLLKAVSSLPQPDSSIVVSQVSGVALGTMTWVFYGLSVLILSFYFLLDGARMSSSITQLCPARYQSELEGFIAEAHISLQNFFRGQIVLGLLFGAFMTVVYLILGMQYALALGLFLGIWEIVPVIGPTLGFLPAVLSVMLEGMSNVPFAVPAGRAGEILILVAIFSLFQWLKDNVIAPRYIGDVIGLHPVLIFIAIMIGARVDGMLGIIVSLPVACVMSVVLRRVRRDTQTGTDTKLTARRKDSV